MGLLAMLVLDRDVFTLAEAGRHFRVGTRSLKRALAMQSLSTPNGIRTRAATLKGWCPRPLDDGGRNNLKTSAIADSSTDRAVCYFRAGTLRT